MSAVDPLAVLAAQAAAIQSGVPDASLDFGAVAQILQAQLAAGDVLEATILPPQGGQDLISILEQTVVAQLPADVHPGDVLLLQVTGFQGNQILVRNLGVQDPNNPVATFIPQLPPQTPQGSSPAATLTTIVGNPGAPAAQTQPQTASPQTPVPVEIPRTSGPPIAPPASVFVAASVRPSPAARQPQQPQEVQAQVPPAPAQPVDIESRLAAARAATAERSIQAPPPEPTQTTAASQAPQQSRPINLPAAPPVITRSAAAVVQQRATAAQPTAAQPTTEQPTAAQPAAEQTIAEKVPVTAAAVQRAPARAANTATILADALASKEPVKILAALRVPATPITLAAARVVTNASTQVQTALQNLEQMLSQVHSSDARVATLQNITTFISHLEPRSAPTLSAQLSAFISNVLGGAENKMAQLLQALAPRAQAVPQAPLSVEHVASGAPAHVPIVAEARAAERQMAISQDLKSTLLSLIANPPTGGSPQLTQAVNESLIALTAMQFNTLIANQQDPSALAMSVPLVFYDGGQASNIRVSRDAPNKKSQRLDADNFHIAFVLDTHALGTVAIDLETVGRAVKVAVKTDRASAVDRFNSSLGDLRARLEHLRYNMTSTGADMVSAQVAQAEPAAPVKTSNVDLQA
ncbi:MAG: hypothetical protein GIW97_07845 [Candidatus Eremiobacteraeota bacterium]|nr:hypothetical protein [Candidatus Eremiobacteraeota bacterium]